MSKNWRQNIRASRRPPSSADRPSTPPLLRSLNKRSRQIKKKHKIHDSQREWINYYSKLRDEYHKIEGELNGLNLTLPADGNLHSEIRRYGQSFLQWKHSITNALSLLQSLSDRPSLDKVREIKDALNEHNDGLDSERDELQRDLRAFHKSYLLMNQDTATRSEDLPMRRENIKFHEFCLQHDIQSKDKHGGWTSSDHRKFTTISAQFGNLPFSKLYGRIKLHFAGKQKKDIKLHHEWYKLYTQHVATNNRMRTEKRVKKKMMAKRARSVQLVQDGMHRLSEQERLEQESFASKLADLRQKSEDIGQIRNAQRREQEKLERERMEKERVEREQQEAEWNEHRMENKGKLDGYYKDKIAHLEAVRMEEERQRVMDEVEHKEIAKVNAQRVEYRETKYTEKIEKQREEQLQKQEEVMLKEERLSRLRMSVQDKLDHENIENISGVTKETESMKNRVSNDQALIYREGVVDMFPDHGYSDDKLFQDPKFELMNRLVATNLHKSKYAREVLKRTGGEGSRKDCSHSAIF